MLKLRPKRVEGLAVLSITISGSRRVPLAFEHRPSVIRPFGSLIIIIDINMPVVKPNSK